MLLAGYAYADWTTRLGAAPPGACCTSALLVGVARLPADPRLDAAGSRRATRSRSLRILLLLGATIGLPYFLLSTTTPLLQAWFWRRFQSAVPYRLFALSNFASLLALLGFPLLFEPAFDLTHARLGLVVPVRRRSRVLCGVHGAGCRSTASRHSRRSHGNRRQALSSKAQLQWLLLSAMGSVMLLAVTNHITQNIAERAVPVGAAARALPGHLHPLLRPSALVPAPGCSSARSACWCR